MLALCVAQSLAVVGESVASRGLCTNTGGGSTLGLGESGPSKSWLGPKFSRPPKL